MKFWAVGSVCILLVSLYQVGSAEQCGRQAGGALCPDGYCCSAFGWCGTGDAYCKDGCQSGCCDDEGGGGGGGGGGGEEGGGGDESGRSITEVISEDDFEQMLMHRNEVSYGCERNGFYTYDAFVTAAKDFPKFGNNGNDTTRKTEIAAFFGQTSHETTGGWEGAPDGPLTWGYCFVTERNKQDYCTPNPTYPCAPGKQYYGRGPIQLTHNVNYGQAGEALGLDLLNDPDLVATDPVVTFKAAIWFWMTAQPPKPSCHDVIIGNWQPSDTDKNAGRLPGYGLTTNIINGGIECGQGVSNAQVENRIDFYKRYCEMFGVSYGDNLDCYHMTPYGNILSALSLSKVA